MHNYNTFIIIAGGDHHIAVFSPRDTLHHRSHTHLNHHGMVVDTNTQ